MTLDEFKKEKLRLTEHRNHKIKNSIGVKALYNYIRKNKWFDIPRPLTEKEFLAIIKLTNNYLSELLLQGHDVYLPQKMGMLELRKYEPVLEFRDGKLVNTLPIDWNATLKLWHEDKNAEKNKVLIRLNEQEIFTIKYSKYNACYNNKVFYEFSISRFLKIKLKELIKNKQIDALKL